MTAGYEYVFYWKDLFREAGVEVPTTWPEFVEVCQTLQEYYGKDNDDFIALGIGLKDEWPDYPFMEFMPSNWMANQDKPFEAGTDIRTAYTRVYELFTSGVLGKDPLGLGNDQINNLFAAKQVAIFPSGDWSLQNIINAGADISELGTFYLPVRMSEDEPYRVIVQGDSLMGVTTHSENPELSSGSIRMHGILNTSHMFQAHPLWKTSRRKRIPSLLKVMRTVLTWNLSHMAEQVMISLQYRMRLRLITRNSARR